MSSAAHRVPVLQHVFRELELLVFGFKTCTCAMRCLHYDIVHVFKCYHHVLTAPVESSEMAFQIILRQSKGITAWG